MKVDIKRTTGKNLFYGLEAVMMTMDQYSELKTLMDEMNLNVEDLEDMEVLCGCTGTACQTRLIW